MSADAKCLTCGWPIVDALAGCCSECAAEDAFIGTQWLTMPHDQRPLASETTDAGLRARVTMNNADRPRQVLVELPPIGKDGRCSVCGTTPKRDTGSCRCPFTVDAALSSSGSIDAERPRLRFGQEVVLDCGPEWGGDHSLYVRWIETTESLFMDIESEARATVLTEAIRRVEAKMADAQAFIDAHPTRHKALELVNGAAIAAFTDTLRILRDLADA